MLDDRGAGNTVTIAIGADTQPQTITVAGAGATTVTYKHNAFGERVSRVEGSTTTHFHYDQDGRLIAESDGTGVVIREYLWLGDKPLGLVVGPASSPTLYLVHADHLERVQKITDGVQTIVWDGQFTPYGRTHAIAGTVQNPLRFPGQWADPAANYFYNYMRDYDPTLARYLSSDPLKMRQQRTARLRHPSTHRSFRSDVLPALVATGRGISLGLQIMSSRSAIRTASQRFLIRDQINAFAYAGANPVVWTDPRGQDIKADILKDALSRLLQSPRACPIPQLRNEADPAQPDCISILRGCRSGCADQYADDPEGLPGTGPDYQGRQRRCIRDCMLAHGCHDF